MLFKYFFHGLWPRHCVFLKVLYKQNDLLGLNRFSIMTPTGCDRCHEPSSWSYHFSQDASATPCNSACLQLRTIPEQTALITRSPEGLHLPDGPGAAGAGGPRRWLWSHAAWHGHPFRRRMERTNLVVCRCQWLKRCVNNEPPVRSCMLFLLEPIVYSLNRGGLNWSSKPAKLSSTTFGNQKFQWPFLSLKTPKHYSVGKCNVISILIQR